MCNTRMAMCIEIEHFQYILYKGVSARLQGTIESIVLSFHESVSTISQSLAPKLLYATSEAYIKSRLLKWSLQEQ